MPLPTTAKVFTQPMDPADVKDFQITIPRGEAETDILRADEGIASFTLTVIPEAAALGLVFGTQPAPILDGNVLIFWVSIATVLQNATAFSGEGSVLGVELTVTTTNSPARKIQRSYGIKVAQA